MSLCENVMQSLGFSCHQQGDILVLNTPFQSRIDGDLFNLYIEPATGGYRITDYGLMLHHAETHYVKNTGEKAKQLHHELPRYFNEQGQIVITTKEHELEQALVHAFNAVQIINQQLPRWKPKPENDHRFIKRVRSFLDSKKITYIKNKEVIGASGHGSRIPFVIESELKSSLIHCLPQSNNHVPEWSEAYKISGLMTDIKMAELPSSYRYVIVDDTDMADASFATASSILHQSTAVLRYTQKDHWIERFMH